MYCPSNNHVTINKRVTKAYSGPLVGFRAILSDLF